MNCNNKISLYLNLIRWDRPAGWMPLMWPTLSALWLAANGFPGWHLLFVFVLGTILMRSAGCCVNDVADYTFDLHVKRTANRPVTTWKISRSEAIMVGAVLALLAFILVLSTNYATVASSFIGLAITILYPYTKRYISMPQAVLGIAFSFGIPMSYLAIRANSFNLEAALPAEVWWLLFGNWFWVLAYDTVYAMVDRDDDLLIGIKTSAITLGRFDLLAVFCFNVLYVFIWSIVLYRHFDGAGPWLIAVAINSAQVLWHSYLIRYRTRAACLRSFSTSHYIGLIFWLGIVLQLNSF
jgi:4-hydroxybenzoate polyprenyltransferase